MFFSNLNNYDNNWKRLILAVINSSTKVPYYEVTHDQQSSPVNEAPEPPKKPPWMLHLASGAISGPLSRTITAPIDRIRITIQVAPQKQTIAETIRYVIKEGGVVSLWRGNLMNILKVGPEMSVRFGAYEKIKSMMHDNTQPFTLKEKFIAGALGGVIGQFSIYPMEVLRTRLTIRKTGQYAGVFDAIKKIHASEGLSGFYRGYKASAAGVIPYTGVDLMMFETLKRRYVYTSGVVTGPQNFTMFWKVMICASISTILGQCCSYPFYLIKAREQAGIKYPFPIKYGITGVKITPILIETAKRDGIFGLYRGVAATLIKVLPAGVLNYLFYEYAQSFLKPFFLNSNT